MHVQGQEVYWKSRYLMLNFAVNLKLFLKIKHIFCKRLWKKSKEGQKIEIKVGGTELQKRRYKSSPRTAAHACHSMSFCSHDVGVGGEKVGVSTLGHVKKAVE